MLLQERFKLGSREGGNRDMQDEQEGMECSRKQEQQLQRPSSRKEQALLRTVPADKVYKEKVGVTKMRKARSGEI